jgi:hypothetical protein
MSIESLAELLRFQSELAVDRAKQNIEQQKATAEQFTPTPAQSAYIGTIFAPGSGIADASGVFPEFPSADVPVSEYLSGEPMPSIAENIAAGGLDRYVVAPLQGLGVVGDALYAVPGAGPVLGATIGSGLKGIGALGIAARAASKSAKTEKGIATLDETKNLIKADVDEFAKDEFGFVSPTLEALIREAPPNLKGPAINDWLAANTQKGVKPKELEVLGIDEFIKANPEATLSEVVAGVAPNKVQITQSVNYQGLEEPTIDFEVSTPELDPLDGSPLHKFETDSLLDAVRSGDQYEIENVIADFNTSNPQAKVKSIDDIEKFLKSKGEDFEDFIDNVAKDRYFDNPYELVKVKSVGEIDANIPNKTFAFGNDEVGYQLFIGGERVTDQNNIAYSRAEAQIQLQNKLSEDGDPLRTVDDPFRDIFTTGNAQYKSYIDETLPGGSNYREVVFRYENAPEPHGVTTHFDDDQALASALIRDRKLDDGVETLHVDELQSDLHTQGSRDGYDTLAYKTERISDLQKTKDDLDESIIILEREIPLAINQLENVSQQKTVNEKFFTKDNFVDYVVPSKQEATELFNASLRDLKSQKNNLENLIQTYKSENKTLKKFPITNFGKQIYDTSNNLDELLKRISAGSDSKSTMFRLALDEPTNINVGGLRIQSIEDTTDLVPNYPFKDDWYVMSLKQLIKDAIDEGKDAISVSGSAPIKARYTDQYSKFYESLYDQKIPSAMKKLANKYGGKFEKGKLDTKELYGMADEIPEIAEANIIRITAEMRAKIAEEGLPSFAFGGAVETPMRLTMPEDVNIFADAQFTQPKTLTEKIASGMTDLAFGRITKDDFFRDNVVRNVLAELDLPAIVQNNLLRSEDAQNFALNTLQQAIGSPVDVTALGDDRFALDYSQKLGPGILSLAGELGSDEPSARVSYDSKDFMISPSTTARFAASLDKDRGKDFSAEVTYQPDPKTFVEGQAIFGEGVSPEYRLNFGRRF